MPGESETRYKHLVVEGFVEVQEYRPPGWPRRKSVPPRDRADHGASLLGQVEQLKDDAEDVRAAQEAADDDDSIGLLVEFESFPEIELAFEKLPREQSGIELRNVRKGGQRTYATVFVPDGKLEHFEKLIREYLGEKKDKLGRPRDHKALVNTIAAIRAASLRGLWTDDADQFPGAESEPLWWEVWLTVRDNREAELQRFKERSEAEGLRVAPGRLVFPERTVLLVFGSPAQMKRSMGVLNAIAELRRAKETAEFFDGLPLEEQREWIDSLLERTNFPEPDQHVPYVCLLDTGINRGHPLLAPVLAEEDLYTVSANWGTDDANGHGTRMAWITFSDDLASLLAGDSQFSINHRLESVKLLPHDGATGDDVGHHGYLTVEGVSRAEIGAPERARLYCMAVTAKDNSDRGRPSAWSAAVDRLAADVEGGSENPRLMIVSAGNVQDPSAWETYPHSNDTDSVHDPAQAWNALTVGAYTRLIHISEEDTEQYEPIAPSGGLSPFSTTSLTWGSIWPMKPDVVMEGGNVARDGVGAVWTASLSLLTTHHLTAQRLLTTLNATSAAAAAASGLAAQIMGRYPELWPETVRGLIVHSAQWTDQMRNMFLPSPSKNDFARLVRRCGFGVPDISRALWTLRNSLTLIAQERLQPFHKEGSKEPAAKELQLHSLPWPSDALEDLGEVIVEMRVTLSYFIEPNPSARGVRSRYRYESHGLRFDVKRPAESVASFRKRINAAARADDDDDDEAEASADLGWTIGKNNRHRGSLHSDIWHGTAAELASRGTIAVYPSMGWWKTRRQLQRYDDPVRYSLIVSIRAPEIDVDLYTPVATQIGIAVEPEV